MDFRRTVIENLVKDSIVLMNLVHHFSILFQCPLSIVIFLMGNVTNLEEPLTIAPHGLITSLMERERPQQLGSHPTRKSQALSNLKAWPQLVHWVFSKKGNQVPKSIVINIKAKQRCWHSIKV